LVIGAQACQRIYRRLVIVDHPHLPAPGSIYFLAKRGREIVTEHLGDLVALVPLRDYLCADFTSGFDEGFPAAKIAHWQFCKLSLPYRRSDPAVQRGFESVLRHQPRGVYSKRAEESSRRNLDALEVTKVNR
jgi:hypothetical protein